MNYLSSSYSLYKCNFIVFVEITFLDTNNLTILLYFHVFIRNQNVFQQRDNER